MKWLLRYYNMDRRFPKGGWKVLKVSFRAVDPMARFEDASAANSTRDGFEGMIGSSEALKRVLDQVRTVAATDFRRFARAQPALGKGLISRAIHNLSPRNNRNFVKFNRAAIPLGLLESELFGHERGAFTGAMARKIGRFELADKGTLFLDGIGEIAPEPQVTESDAVSRKKRSRVWR